MAIFCLDATSKRAFATKQKCYPLLCIEKILFYSPLAAVLEVRIFER